MNKVEHKVQFAGEGMMLIKKKQLNTHDWLMKCVILKGLSHDIFELLWASTKFSENYR